MLSVKALGRLYYHNLKNKYPITTLQIDREKRIATLYILDECPSCGAKFPENINELDPHPTVKLVKDELWQEYGKQIMPEDDYRTYLLELMLFKVDDNALGYLAINYLEPMYIKTIRMTTDHNLLTQKLRETQKITGIGLNAWYRKDYKSFSIDAYNPHPLYENVFMYRNANEYIISILYQQRCLSSVVENIDIKRYNSGDLKDITSITIKYRINKFECSMCH